MSRVQWLIENIELTHNMTHLEKFPSAATFRLPEIDEPQISATAIQPSRFSVMARAREYMQKIDPAVSGDHGHDKTYYAACRMIHGFGLTTDEAYPIMVEYSQRCAPPWTDKDIRHKLEDAFRAEGPRGYLLDAKAGNKSSTKQDEEPPTFPDLKLASELIRPEGEKWLWEGYLALGCITLLTALPKAGKTTLLARLIQSMEQDGEFIGLPLQGGHVIYVTEEPEAVWFERHESNRFGNHLHLWIRPIQQSCDWSMWDYFLEKLSKHCQKVQPSLVVFDTLPDMWPVKKENEASEVISALKPLRSISEKSDVLLVHHNRKSDGIEGTAARGSGALAGYVDVIAEYRRYNPNDDNDCRRVLKSWGRMQGTINEMVVEMTEEGFVAQGGKKDMHRKDMVDDVFASLPFSEPGLTISEIHDLMENPPRKQKLLRALQSGIERGGIGKSGDGLKSRFWAINSNGASQ